MRPPTSPIAERQAPAVPTSEPRKQKPASHSQIGRAFESPSSARRTSEPSSSGTRATAISASVSAAAAGKRRWGFLITTPMSGGAACCRVALYSSAFELFVLRRSLNPRKRRGRIRTLDRPPSAPCGDSRIADFESSLHAPLLHELLAELGGHVQAPGRHVSTVA